ncbi:lipid II:glycine glycyltransferase FemX [Halorussus salinus]|uniref:lipid II:glycine glycyltransferase FemX n=1 Tax=Halorussus salinus TaxID=1364935 RepID=UPI0010932374|nr:GNAT family N-acetyltransferase [Halorussus salinus]
MTVRVETTSDADEWDACVEQSPQTGFFHQHDALATLADHFDARLHTLVGYVGQEPVGVFPVFGLERGPLWVAASQPPGVEINTGPALLNHEKLKQRKAEKRHRKFLSGCMEFVEEVLDPDYCKIATTDRYDDVRPLVNHGLDVRPSYTYVLDLEPGAEELMAQFSSDARSNVRNTDEDRYEIREGGVEEVARIVSFVRRRYDEQDEDHYLDADLATDLYETLGDEAVRPYVCEVDGEVESGLLALEYGDTVYRWQGGPRPRVDVPVNDLLDWRVIRDAVERDLARYDLVGAMLPRLCEYKAKFGPEPRPVYLAERRNLTAKLASETYRGLRTLRGLQTFRGLSLTD